MEYTKDVILGVSYGQAEKTRFQFLENMVKVIKKHKFITTIVSMTCLLCILDFMLISSFISVLSSM